MSDDSPKCGCGNEPEKKEKAGDVNNESCCCGPAPKKNIKYISVSSCCCGVDTPAGKVPYTWHEWSIGDHAGEVMVRLGFKRMEYAVSPGLYAFGEPDKDSPVLVSANYKLSFDVLRREIKGLNAWILVVDTKGVNVWCAAGKGTFCAEEVAARIKETGLEKVVAHRNVILPQLSAPGVAAHKVRELSGFRAIFGPVEARDIRRFIESGMKADTGMREVQFGLLRRVETSWLELASAFLPSAVFAAVILAVSGWTKSGYSFAGAVNASGIYIAGLITAVISGSLLFSMLLPYLRFRYFSVKGALLGAFAAMLLIFFSGTAAAPFGLLKVIAVITGASAVSSFIAMNYTGATVFTSISGAKQEVTRSMPFIKALGGISTALILIGIIIGSIK